MAMTTKKLVNYGEFQIEESVFYALKEKLKALSLLVKLGIFLITLPNQWMVESNPPLHF